MRLIDAQDKGESSIPRILSQMQVYHNNIAVICYNQLKSHENEAGGRDSINA